MKKEKNYPYKTEKMNLTMDHQSFTTPLPANAAPLQEQQRAQMQCIEEVVAKNNEACQTIHNGRYGSASSDLAKALARLKQVLPRNNSAAETSATNNGAASLNHHSENNGSESINPLRFVGAAAAAAETENTESCGVRMLDSIDTTLIMERYYYQSPVEVNTAWVLSRGVANNSFEMIAFAIIYNLALCHHLDAMALKLNSTTECNVSREGRLKQATALYNHAKNLFVSNARLQNETMHWLTLANNIGHALYEIGDTNNAQQWHKRLHSGIMLIMQNGSDEDIQALSLDRDRLDGFMTNVMLLDGPCPIGAPAA